MSEFSELSDSTRDLVDAPNLAFLATVNADGSPQLSPVWLDREGDTLLVNTSIGTAKERNMRREPRVAVSVADRGDFYRRIVISGSVVAEVEGDEAERHLDALARKYLDVDTYPDRKASERRIIFRIRPDRVHDRA